MKKYLLFILLNFTSLSLLANDPFLANIIGSEKASICSIWIPYKLKINNGHLISNEWTLYCDNEPYNDFIIKTPYLIYLNTPTNVCTISIECDFVYERNLHHYQGYVSLDVQVKIPTFQCARQPGIDGINHSLNTHLPIHFNIDDDDRSAENNPMDLGWDYLQNEMTEVDNDLNHVTLTSIENDLNVSHCVFTFSETSSLRAWRSPKKGSINGIDSFLVIAGSLNVAHVYVEGVELGNGSVDIFFNGNHIQNLKYKCYAVTYGRQPMVTEHRPGYASLTGCEWSIIDANVSYQNSYNSLAYVVDPTQSEAFGVPFFVEKTDPLCSNVYSLINVNGKNKTSVDSFGDKNGSFSNSDVKAFFEYQPIWPDNFLGVNYNISEYDAVYFSLFFASRAATPSMKSGKYGNWILFHSKYKEAEIILHRFSQINMGDFVQGYIFAPSIY